MQKTYNKLWIFPIFILLDIKQDSYAAERNQAALILFAPYLWIKKKYLFILRFGARDAKARHATKEKQYDLILDDEIEFIQVIQK
jgi:hypothetical protein